MPKTEVVCCNGQVGARRTRSQRKNRRGDRTLSFCPRQVSGLSLMAQASSSLLKAKEVQPIHGGLARNEGRPASGSAIELTILLQLKQPLREWYPCVLHWKKERRVGSGRPASLLPTKTFLA